MGTSIKDFLRQQGFTLEREDLRRVADVFSSEAQRALCGEASSLQMIDSHLFASTSCGCRGTVARPPVIVIDAGGTNLRVASVRLTEKGPVFAHVRKSEMPGTRGTISADAFHAAIAAEVDAVRAQEPQASCIGYCFSYECRSLADGDAELVAWSKQIDAPDVVGQRVGAELVRRLKGGPLPIVVLNDTVATLLAGAVTGGERYPGQIGFILGTGTNLACIENGTIRNAETGECDKVPRTSCDAAFDATLPDAGAAQFEKMVSGAYLGGVGLHLLKRAADAGLLAGEGLSAVSSLSTCELDSFAVAGIRPEDAETAREIARAVFRRAALLTAAHLAAFVRRSAEAGRSPVRITVDGSTYWKVRSVDFDGIVRKELAELAPGISFDVFRIDDAPMVGAAVAAVSVGSRNIKTI